MEEGGESDDSSSSSSTSDDNRNKVIVIGAGIAGISAAEVLSKMGVESLILEAGDRIGGRICTNIDKFDFPVDMGASWIHGNSPLANPVAAAAKAGELRTYQTASAGRPTYDHDLLGGFSLYRPGGGGEIDREQAREFDSWFSSLMDEIRADKTLGDMNVTEAIDQAILGKDLSLDWRRMLAWFKCRIEGWFAADCDKIPARNWITEVLHAGGHSVLLDGYSSLVDSIVSKANLNVKLNRKVARIEYGGDQVEILCHNGEIFRAGAVIVTVPLGVLKSGSLEFDPPLPKRKIEAMGRLGIGHQNKIALLFDEIFWPEDSLFVGGVSDTPSDCSYFLAYSKSHGRPALTYMPVGELALELEKMSDEGARDFAMGRLRQMIPTAPDPVSCIVSRWGTDPNFLGCYSLEGVHHQVGSNQESQDAHGILGEVLMNRLFFAGEATSSDFPGTVHGAYASGIKAAHHLLQGGICLPT